MSDKVSGKQTLIEEGTKFSGSFASDCPIVVKGAIDGDISGPSLTVSATGAVSGKVKVKELRSEGSISGEYDADLVELSGRVQDNTIIRAKRLEVKLAPERGRMQVVFGECELDVGEIPTKAEAIEEAKRPESIAAPAPSQPPSADAAEAAAESGVDASDDGGDLDDKGNRRNNKGDKKRRGNTVPPPAE
jgi:cytoskeletal protein CcmA (bactofilin family)